MKYLIDSAAISAQRTRDRHPELVAGQLITPLTRYSRWADVWALDNGCFGRFDKIEFLRLMERESAARESCLFVCCPDVVGNARRTMESFDQWWEMLGLWPIALVAQDGVEDLEIPWRLLKAIFIGGTDRFKNSVAAIDIVKTATLLEVHSHVGRVNTAKRFIRYHEAGADTCDGSGVSRYDHMLDAIARELADDRQSLFDREGGEEVVSS